LQKFNVKSIYQLETEDRFKIASALMSQPGYNIIQLSRCLIVNELQLRSSNSQYNDRFWKRNGKKGHFEPNHQLMGEVRRA